MNKADLRKSRIGGRAVQATGTACAKDLGQDEPGSLEEPGGGPHGWSRVSEEEREEGRAGRGWGQPCRPVGSPEPRILSRAMGNPGGL